MEKVRSMLMHSIRIDTTIALQKKIRSLMRVNEMFYPNQMNIKGSNDVSGRKYDRISKKAICVTL